MCYALHHSKWGYKAYNMYWKYLSLWVLADRCSRHDSFINSNNVSGHWRVSARHSRIRSRIANWNNVRQFSQALRASLCSYSIKKWPLTKWNFEMDQNWKCRNWCSWKARNIRISMSPRSTPTLICQSSVRRNRQLCPAVLDHSSGSNANRHFPTNPGRLLRFLGTGFGLFNFDLFARSKEVRRVTIFKKVDFISFWKFWKL